MCGCVTIAKRCAAGLRLPWTCGKCKIRTAPACRAADQNAAFHQRQNVAEGGILGARGELGIFRSGELALEAIQEAVEHEALAFVD
jgi:hypothetical protein